MLRQFAWLLLIIPFATGCHGAVQEDIAKNQAAIELNNQQQLKLQATFRESNEHLIRITNQLAKISQALDAVATELHAESKGHFAEVRNNLQSLSDELCKILRATGSSIPECSARPTAIPGVDKARPQPEEAASFASSKEPSGASEVGPQATPTKSQGQK